MFQESKHRLQIKVASPIIEIPFHSTLLNKAPKLSQEQEEKYNRTWLFNLGTINFQTINEKQGDTQILDIYERYLLKIDQISIVYLWLGLETKKMKVLKEIEINLQIGVQNKARAALILGDHQQKQNEQESGDLERPAYLLING